MNPSAKDVLTIAWAGGPWSDSDPHQNLGYYAWISFNLWPLVIDNTSYKTVYLVYTDYDDQHAPQRLTISLFPDDVSSGTDQGLHKTEYVLVEGVWRSGLGPSPERF